MSFASIMQLSIMVNFGLTVCKEDFEHHRFCDEFSHLVNRHFMAISTVNRCLRGVIFIMKMYRRCFEASQIL